MPRKRGDSWSCQHRYNNQRFWFTLGKISKADAMIADGHIGRILASFEANASPPIESVLWLKQSTQKVRDVFRKAGISLADRRRLTVEEAVKEFNKDYKQKDRIAHRTIVRMRQCTEKLGEYFKDTYLDDVGVSEAKAFSRWLKREYKAESTWSKSLQRCRQFFAWAIEHEFISKNPMVNIKGGRYENDSRQFYVDKKLIDSVLEIMPEGDFKIAVALGRFAGLRLPSELGELTWERINLPGKTMVIWDVKRSRDRVTPIFPELHKHLERHWELFGDQSDYVIVDPAHRDPNANLRTTFGKYVVRAGHAKWPRLMQNLRASCESDLLNRFPIHKVVKWIGNSPNVALKHYAMVSDQDVAQAAAEPLLAQGVEAGQGDKEQEVNEPVNKTCKPLKRQPKTAAKLLPDFVNDRKGS